MIQHLLFKPEMIVQTANSLGSPYVLEYTAIGIAAAGILDSVIHFSSTMVPAVQALFSGPSYTTGQLVMTVGTLMYYGL